MMSETYVECLVKKKTSSGMMFLRMLTIAMAVAFLFAGLSFLSCRHCLWVWQWLLRLILFI